MITLGDEPIMRGAKKYEFAFNGLSTDTKPIGTYDYGSQVVGIANQSTFMEMDKKKVYFYDEANEQWV